MPQDPAASHDSGTLAVSSRRDLQRYALQGLVTLTRECAATEIEIDARLAAAQSKAKKVMDAAVDRGNVKYKAIEQAVRAYYARRVEEVDKTFQSKRDALTSEAKTRRQRVNHEHDSVGQDVKQKLDQATWLADSVLEAAEIRVREEYKKAKERVALGLAHLDELEDKVSRQMEEFGQPVPRLDDVEPTPPADDPTAEFEKHKTAAEQHLAELSALSTPRLMSGGKPWLLGLVLVLVAAAIPQAIKMTLEPQIPALPIAVGVALAVAVGGSLFLASVVRKQVAAAFVPLRRSLDAARKATKDMSEAADRKRESDYEAAVKTRKSDIQAAKEKLNPAVAQAGRRRDEKILALRNDYAKQLALLEEKRDTARGDADEWQRRMLPKLHERADRHLQAALDRNDAAVREARRRHDEERAALEKKWAEGLAQVRAPIGESSRAAGDWTEANWDAWVPPKTFAETVRFGEFQVDLRKVIDGVSPDGKFTLPLPGAFMLPAMLAFPNQASLLIHTDRNGRADAVRTLQLVMVRLLTCMPPGRVRFTIIDPVGLGQNFAGFMHLADYDESLVGTRIWTDHEHIEQRLADLTEHMETVIQKYLRNEFETIDQYNAQAGELSEPYRVLVITDFPTGFEADSFRRLSSIASSGPRCGVFTIIMRDTRLPIPAGSHFEDLESRSVNLVRDGDKFVWRDEVFKQFPLTLDPPPPEEALTKILQMVGKHAKDANRVEVPFEQITPRTDLQLWSLDSGSDLNVPVGRMGATRMQNVRLGRGMAQHALVAGKTGSGKSSLLNAMITNLALWYAPEQVELYLIDFKKGVEFKTYATYSLPHARAIAVESDREFGLSVLQRIDAELTRRGELYRKLGVQDLASYRQADATPMPRTLLVIDEFQEFFSEDDKLAQEASLLLDRLVRQGRAFGIHVMLGSQTLAGSGGLSRSTIGQMAVRIALQCSEADSQLILGDNNSAARLLSRPGEAIYNDVGGLVEGNSPFQVAWLPDEKREDFLKQVHAKAQTFNGRYEAPIVFEGNAPAPIGKNVQLQRLIDDNAWAQSTPAPVAYLGEPVAIKSPTAVAFRRQSGANMLIVGQQDEAAMAMAAVSLVALAAQLPPGGATFYVLDGSPADSPLAWVLPAVKAALPHDVKLVDYRAVPEAVGELAAELEKRQAGDGTTGPETFVFIYGLQRYRALRKQEESYSFSMEEGEKKADPGKQFADLLREGPPLGMHVVAWADTPVSVERTLERTALREFDNRVLFQMSANDSSNLIDSPAANKLGANRALSFSEEQGTMEKFRPYAVPDKEWLEGVKARLDARAAVAPEPAPAG